MKKFQNVRAYPGITEHSQNGGVGQPTYSTDYIKSLEDRLRQVEVLPEGILADSESGRGNVLRLTCAEER